MIHAENESPQRIYVRAVWQTTSLQTIGQSRTLHVPSGVSGSGYTVMAEALAEELTGTYCPARDREERE